jgi:3-dehydroquinate dehydratase-1
MRICASIMESTIEGFVEKASLAKGADLIEIRVDGLKEQSPLLAEELLRRIKDVVEVPVILTNRGRNEGGAFRGTEEERVGIIQRCIDLVDLVDVEYSTERALRDGIIRELKEAGGEVIVSYHDFKGTPDKEEMLALLRSEHEAGADIAKLAVTAKTYDDVLSLLYVTNKASKEGRVVTISMGDVGRLSRIAAPFFGSEITYASVGRVVAPGQMELNELKRILEVLG